MAELGFEDQNGRASPLSSEEESPRPRAEKRPPGYLQEKADVEGLNGDGENEEIQETEDDQSEELEEVEEVQELRENGDDEDEEIQEIQEDEEDESEDEDNKDGQRDSFINNRFQERVDGKKKSWSLHDAIEDAKIDFGKFGLAEQDIESKNEFHPLYDLYDNVLKQLEFHFKSNQQGKALSEAAWVKNARNNLKDACIAHYKGVWVGKETDKRDPTSSAPTHSVVLALRYASPTGNVHGAIAGYLASLGLAHLMQIAPAAEATFTGGGPSQAEEQIWVAIEALKAKLSSMNRKMKSTKEEMEDAIDSLQERHKILSGKIGKGSGQAAELDAREKKLMARMREYVKKECFLRSEIDDSQKTERPATTKAKAPKPSSKSQPPAKTKTKTQAPKSSSNSQATGPAETEREPYVGTAFLHRRGEDRAKSVERRVIVVNAAQNTLDNILPEKKRKVDNNESRPSTTKKRRLEE
ncbi:hypothetical protein B0T10DRAFT_590530 [Thelonectria olida]|uniref:Uncharacterized protein n=1 Tax=Thelonectria olida TaxID=1576542 RepID=A0A9P9AIZ4_9HYPO|nr:hypothetical protein B0T10DRAFT_590530 [Thelonectria olida]